MSQTHFHKDNRTILLVFKYNPQLVVNFFIQIVICAVSLLLRCFLSAWQDREKMKLIEPIEYTNRSNAISIVIKVIIRTLQLLEPYQAVCSILGWVMTLPYVRKWMFFVHKITCSDRTLNVRHCIFVWRTMLVIYQVDKILRMQVASAKSYQPGKSVASCNWLPGLEDFLPGTHHLPPLMCSSLERGFHQMIGALTKMENRFATFV